MTCIPRRRRRKGLPLGGAYCMGKRIQISLRGAVGLKPPTFGFGLIDNDLAPHVGYIAAGGESFECVSRHQAPEPAPGHVKVDRCILH